MFVSLQQQEKKSTNILRHFFHYLVWSKNVTIKVTLVPAKQHLHLSSEWNAFCILYVPTASRDAKIEIFKWLASLINVSFHSCNVNQLMLKYWYIWEKWSNHSKWTLFIKNNIKIVGYHLWWVGWDVGKDIKCIKCLMVRWTDKKGSKQR